MHRKNVIAVACGLASIGIAVTIYLRSDLLPQAEKVFAENAQKAALLAANIEDSEQLKDQHAAIKNANQAIADRMIRMGQIAENYQYFYKLESDTGIKVIDMRQVPSAPPLKGAPKTSFTPVAFSLTVQGTHPQLLDLLRRLEGGEHYCRILTCGFHPLGETRGGPISMLVTLELLGTP